MSFKRISLGIIVLALLAVSCGGKKNVTQYMTSREHFQYAMKFFQKKHYLKAQEEFSLITYKYSGSDVADDAQYYLAECYFEQKDYVSAASEYERVVSSYPKSEFVEKSMYRLVICYDELSPGFALDQKFTYEALKAVQNYLDLYPQSERRADVEKIHEAIKTKLARKQFESANIYRKLSEYEAAIVYYDQVITEFYDSKFSSPSKFWKGYCYFKLKEFQKASLILKRFADEKDKDMELAEEAQKILKEIDELQKKQGGTKLSQEGK